MSVVISAVPRYIGALHSFYNLAAKPIVDKHAMEFLVEKKGRASCVANRFWREKTRKTAVESAQTNIELVFDIK